MKTHITRAISNGILYLGVVVGSPLIVLKVSVAILILLDVWAQGIITRFWQVLEEQHNKKSPLS